MTGALLALACSRANPGFDDGGGGTSDGGVSSDGGTTEAVGPDAGATSSVPTTGGSSSSGADGVCGDGILDEDEDCDDGNTEDDGICSADCRIPGEVEWELEFEPDGPGLHRFNASTIHDGDLVAVGRAVLAPGAPQTAVVVRYDVEEGVELSRAALGEPWIDGEAHAVHGDGPFLYVSGQGELGFGFAGFAVCFEVIEREEPPEECWQLELLGNTSRAVDVEPSGVLVTMGNFFNSGHGAALLNPETGEPQWEWLTDTEEDVSQFEALERYDGRPVVAGTMSFRAVLAEVTEDSMTTQPSFFVMGDGLGPDRAQAMAVVPGGVILGGWLDNSGSGVDAWLGRYDIDGTPMWEVVEDAGSFERDEVEGVAVDGAGHVIAVGMTGDPSVATVWKLDVSDGSEIWSRSYPELVPGNSFFRDVEIDGDLFVVGERRDGGDSVGVVMRLVP